MLQQRFAPDIALSRPPSGRRRRRGGGLSLKPAYTFLFAGCSTSQAAPRRAAAALPRHRDDAVPAQCTLRPGGSSGIRPQANNGQLHRAVDGAACRSVQLQ